MNLRAHSPTRTPVLPHSMPNKADVRARALVIQLARLGDVVQTLPAITALRAQGDVSLDLLCAVSFGRLARAIPGIDRVLPWEGTKWQCWAEQWPTTTDSALNEVRSYLHELAPMAYDLAYNLNQHPRAIMAAHLLARQVRGPGQNGPLSPDLPPWASYLRQVVADRRTNRIHLSDTFCGLCGVQPPGTPPRLLPITASLPPDLAAIGDREGPWVALVVGAGDHVRCVPIAVWVEWITAFLSASPTGQVVMIGSGTERDKSQAIQDGLSSVLLGRVWDATGRTELPQLATVLARCQWVVGADTGPLHLGTAVGARAMGFYFAQARVHETGPYGRGHWVWQAEGERHEARGDGSDLSPCPSPLTPHLWPIAESVELILTGSCQRVLEGWSLWESHLDDWGAYFTEAGSPVMPDQQREAVWRTIGAPPAMELSS